MSAPKHPAAATLLLLLATAGCTSAPAPSSSPTSTPATTSPATVASSSTPSTSAGESPSPTVTSPTPVEPAVVGKDKSGRPLYAPTGPAGSAAWPWVVTDDAWGPIQIGKPMSTQARQRFTWVANEPMMSCAGAWTLTENGSMVAMVVPLDHTQNGAIYRISVNRPGTTLASGGSVGKPISAATAGMPQRKAVSDIGWRQTRGHVDTVIMGMGGTLDLIDLSPTGWGLGPDMFATEWHC